MLGSNVIGSNLVGSTLVLDAGASVQTIQDAGGILSAEAFGTAQANQNIAASGIASAEAFGTAKLNLNVLTSGIASAEAFGTAVVSAGASVQTIQDAGGILSAEAFGILEIWAAGSRIITGGWVPISRAKEQSSRAVEQKSSRKPKQKPAPKQTPAPALYTPPAGRLAGLREIARFSPLYEQEGSHPLIPPQEAVLKPVCVIDIADSAGSYNDEEAIAAILLAA